MSIEALLVAAEAVLASSFAANYRRISPFKELAAAVETVRMQLPTGVALSDDQDSPPISPAVAEAGDLRISKPEMIGIHTQIQHPTTSGKPPTTKPGLIGGSVVHAADGPRVLIQMKHADGSSLGAILLPDEYLAFGECYAELGASAGLLAATRGAVQQ